MGNKKKSSILKKTKIFFLKNTHNGEQFKNSKKFLKI